MSSKVKISDKTIDTGEKQFLKFDSDKPRYDLLPAYPLDEVVKVLTFGSRKYSANNFVKCTSVMRYFAACLRHLFSWARGENVDEESGLHPLAHSIACLLFILEILRANPSSDDRYNSEELLNG